jgi:hypothetical protein
MGVTASAPKGQRGASATYLPTDRRNFTLAGACALFGKVRLHDPRIFGHSLVAAQGACGGTPALVGHPPSLAYGQLTVA